MTDALPDISLSAAARSYQAELLPNLLVALRHRRRAQQRRRAVVAAAAVALTISAAWLAWPRARWAPVAPPPAARWQVVADDPGVFARCAVATVARAEWFLDDAGLQDLLADAGRASGLVRIGAHTDVTKAAYDPWPGTSP